MNKSYDKINEWTETLANRLLEIRFWDKEEIKTALSVHLAMAMKECLEIQMDDTRRQINQAKIKIAGCGGVNQQRFQADLVKLKGKMTEEHQLLLETKSIIRKDEKYRVMCLIVAEKYGGDALEYLKSKVKLSMNGFTENKSGDHLPDNAYSRGTKDLKQKLKEQFESKGMASAIEILEQTQ